MRQYCQIKRWYSAYCQLDIYLRTKKMHHLFICLFFNKSIYFSSKFIKQCVTNHIIILICQYSDLINRFNTRSNVIYTTQGPVMFTLSMAAKFISLHSITLGKVKLRRKMGGDLTLNIPQFSEIERERAKGMIRLRRAFVDPVHDNKSQRLKPQWAQNHTGAAWPNRN